MSLVDTAILCPENSQKALPFLEAAAHDRALFLPRASARLPRRKGNQTEVAMALASAAAGQPAFSVLRVFRFTLSS